jgi:hypothetical protein
MSEHSQKKLESGSWAIFCPKKDFTFVLLKKANFCPGCGFNIKEPEEPKDD